MNDRILARLAALQFTPHGAVPIGDLERDLSYKLPAEYLAFLVATGGGGFADSVICRCKVAPPVACDGCTMFDEFLGLSGNSSLRVARRWGANLDMSPSLLTIADAPGGDFYCLSPCGGRLGVGRSRLSGRSLGRQEIVVGFPRSLPEARAVDHL